MLLFPLETTAAKFVLGLMTAPNGRLPTVTVASTGSAARSETLSRLRTVISFVSEFTTTAFLVCRFRAMSTGFSPTLISRIRARFFMSMTDTLLLW